MLLLVHVALSLYALFAGALVVIGLLKNRDQQGWTATFLGASIATSASGYLFDARAFGPPQIVGVVSLLALVVAVFALYVRRLAGPWRPTYVITTLLAFYLNAFVGVVQAFDKIPPLHALAPNGSGPVFAVAQTALLAVFVLLGFRAVKRFRPERGTQLTGFASID